jgi:aryl-alcohol dehydrogenase-like predicted oxidoreductase
VAVIREALNSGVNLVDTAESYGTESIVGDALQGIDRASVVISTKKSAWAEVAPEEVGKSLDASLQRLGTDYVDIYSLHAVPPERYDHLLLQIAPILENLRDEGKIRFIGITELFLKGRDPGHEMLQRALEDEVWDVVMVGHNIINQSARERVLTRTASKGVGTLIMYAVRKALSNPERLREVVGELIETAQIDPGMIDQDDPLGFLVHEGGAVSLPDAAYRFCRDEPGADVILSGTGSLAHLRENLRSFARPPLPAEDVRAIRLAFGQVDSVTGG